MPQQTKRYGKLFKVKAENDSTAKIEMLPEHCIIDNDNHLTIAEVGKPFYIEMAKKESMIFRELSPKEKKSTRTTKNGYYSKETKTTNLNVYQKLIMAREQFLNADINQSGKNMQLSFKYLNSKTLFHRDVLASLTRLVLSHSTASPILWPHHYREY